MWNLLLAIWLAGSIEGRLWNPVSGAPVRKADVVVGTTDGVPVKRVITDTQGHYSVSGLPAGRYRVAAGRAGFLPALADIVIELRADEVRGNVNIAMQPPAVITGHIFDSEDEPVERVSVTAFSKGPAGLTRAAGGLTNDEGEYRIPGLAAGSYVLRTSQADTRVNTSVNNEIYAPVFFPGTEDAAKATAINLAAGSEARDLDLRIHKVLAGSVSGIVQGAGSQLLVVTMARQGSVEAEITASSGGRFTFPKLAPGVYQVSTQLDHPIRRAMAQITVASGAATQILLTLQEPPAGSGP